MPSNTERSFIPFNFNRYLNRVLSKSLVCKSAFCSSVWIFSIRINFFLETIANKLMTNFYMFSFSVMCWILCYAYCGLIINKKRCVKKLQTVVAHLLLYPQDLRAATASRNVLHFTCR
ncbi:hypothetical protein HanRHA438_Chr14g0647691 [Helianthus annuus]|nr:hypothetical protein HanRHA438_Chr14g0647691 [Helianthus annuus]